MTEFILRRIAEGRDSTAGQLLIWRAPLNAEGELICATLEQEWNNNRPRESRIPPGRYKLAVKPFGTSRFDDEYRKKFGAWHLGMIELEGVPDRSAILFHMGNYHRHTEGCPLLGLRTVKEGENWQIPPGESRPGYVKAYPLLLAAAHAGTGWVTVKDPEPLIA
jgi:Family of unknown function (DUF5675)